MRKLKLDVLSLTVETFKVDASRDARGGTVRGAEYTHESDCAGSCAHLCGPEPLTPNFTC